MNSPITLHVPFGKTERVNLSKANIQNSPNQLHSQSFSSHSLLISSHGKSILLFAEARKLGSKLDSPTFVTPLSDCQEISRFYSQYVHILTAVLSHHLLTEHTSCHACFSHRPDALPQSILNMAARVNPIKYNMSGHLSVQKLPQDFSFQ